MLFRFINLSDHNPRRSMRSGAPALLVGISLILPAVWAVPALAQDDTIGVTYQSGPGGIKTVTAPVTGTTNPTATVRIPDASFSAEGNETASLDDGSAFVVTPIIDPELRLFYTLTNRTSAPLTNLTFTLQTADDFFFDSLAGFEPRSARFSATFDQQITGFNNRYRSLTFTYSANGPGLTSGDFEQFSFAMNVPATTGQSLGVQLRPNNGPELQFNIPGAPEPGSASLVLLAGAVCLPLAAVKVRRRLGRK